VAPGARMVPEPAGTVSSPMGPPKLVILVDRDVAAAYAGSHLRHPRTGGRIMCAGRTFAATLSLLLASFCGCDRTSDNGPAPLSSTRAGNWPVNYVDLQHAQITVHSGTSFDCFGKPCLLLGVKESDDPARRKAAEMFTRKWFEEQHNTISILNDNNPLMKDQKCVCWVAAACGVWPYLNRDLVRAGLVDLDLTPFEGYSFTVQKKSDPDSLFHWQEVLLNAKQF
jgi:hypothetical protein